MKDPVTRAMQRTERSANGQTQRAAPAARDGAENAHERYNRVLNREGRGGRTEGRQRGRGGRG